jgi:cell division protein ZipA
MDPIDQDVAREAAAARARPPAAGEDEVPVARPLPERDAPVREAVVPPAPASADHAVPEQDDGGAEAVPAAPSFEQAPLFAGEPIVARDEPREAGRRGRGGRRAEPARTASAKSGPAPKAGSAKSAPAKAEPLGPPEDVIVINVLCRRDEVADGPTLVETITDHGLRFGDMNIFHRVSPSDRGRTDFSLASAVEPGTFDLGALEDFSTPGVTLFMQLPGPAQPLEAFEDMVSIARGIASRIGADLKDERHSVMTAQTIEHCRQRIRDFTRRQMSRRG